jgi:SAM-dependent methyltransferase
MELAVGSGRIAVPLAEAGHQVLGIDLDSAMLDRARRRAADARVVAGGARGPLRLELVEGDALEVRAADRGRFALVVLALNSLLLFPEAREQERAIATMAQLARSGGLVVVDAWQPQPIDLVRMDGRVSLEWLREDPETGRQVTKLAAAWYDPPTRVATVTTIFDEARQGEPPVRWTRRDRLRLASGEELVAWAGAAGLEVERLAGDHDLTPYGSASERAILVARKPG